MKNLVLIGMPGSGKSTVGVLCAKALGMPFMDTDLVMQARCGQLLQQLVDELGTEGFLYKEEECILGIDYRNTVIATGGSVALEERAMAHLKRNSVVFYLKLPCERKVTRNDDQRGTGTAAEQHVHTRHRDGPWRDAAQPVQPSRAILREKRGHNHRRGRADAGGNRAGSGRGLEGAVNSRETYCCCRQ